MAGIPGPENIFTGLWRIADLAGKAPEMAFTSLNHYLTQELLTEAYRLTRRDGVPGVDGVTWAEYGKNLKKNLEWLRERAKAGTYEAPPVRRSYVPKGDGKLRPLGIPTLEDKVLQRAVVMILDKIYEQDFLDCSYGFRPGRSAHQALEALRAALWKMKGGHIVDADIKGYFDNISHSGLERFLDRRVRDGVIRRLIAKWLRAGVMEDGELRRTEKGTPQGGVISPLLANIYLHEVLDEWFYRDVLPRLRGRAELIRYADDFVIACETEEDARRIMDVLPKRFGKYGLQLHPEKTRLIDFRNPGRAPPQDGGGKPGTFDLLGFTHYWGLSRNKRWMVKQKTAKDRVRKKLKQFAQWCKENRHKRFREQHAKISASLRGHYGYFGIGGNMRSITYFAHQVTRIWRKWLGRRSQRANITWKRFREIMEQFPLPKPVIAHPYARPAANPSL